MFYQQRHDMDGAVIGTIMPWSGSLSNIPDGWLICNGNRVIAREFPLLARSIGDTYNEATNIEEPFNASELAFPNYSGKFSLPNLLQGKALVDIEQSYFSAGGKTDRFNLGIDTDPDAGNIIGPYIGTNTDNGFSPAITDVRTDVEFTLNDRTGYAGDVTGNKIIPGQGEKSVFIGGRKLGHEHVRPHQHSGSYETVQNVDPTRPGLGVIPWDNVAFQYKYGSYDETTSFPLSDQESDYIRANLQFWKTGTGSEQYLGDKSFSQVGNAYSGFGSGGQPGRAVGQVQSENPPSNLHPIRVTRSPFTPFNSWTPAGSGTGTSTGPEISSQDVIPYGSFGSNITVPLGFRNYYPDEPSEPARATLVSNPAEQWTVGNQFFAHAHDPFQVVYKQGSLGPQPRLEAVVNIPNAELDNTSNEGALQIDMNVSQPSLTCIYLIRAY
jgi:hypothetical protein